MSHVMHRTLTGMSVGLGVIALFLWCPLRAVGGIVLVLSCLAQLEFYQLAKRYEPVTWFGILVGAAWILCTGYMDANEFSGSMCFFVPFAFVIAFFVQGLAGSAGQLIGPVHKNRYVVGQRPVLGDRDHLAAGFGHDLGTGNDKYVGSFVFKRFSQDLIKCLYHSQSSSGSSTFNL